MPAGTKLPPSPRGGVELHEVEAIGPREAASIVERRRPEERDRVGAGGVEAIDARRRGSLGKARMHAIHDERVCVHALALEPLGEESHLPERKGIGGRDEDVGDVGTAERRGDRGGPRRPPTKQRIHFGHELGDLLEEAAPGQLAEALEQRGGAPRDEIEAEAAELSKASDSHLIAGLSIAPARRSGASRKSSAFVVGGVSSRTRS